MDADHEQKILKNTIGHKQELTSIPSLLFLKICNKMKSC